MNAKFQISNFELKRSTEIGRIFIECFLWELLLFLRDLTKNIFCPFKLEMKIGFTRMNSQLYPSNNFVNTTQ